MQQALRFSCTRCGQCCAAAWHREARRCEGINRGRVVARSTIRRSLLDCLEQQD